MNIMTKRGSQDNVVTYEHLCDTAADLQNIDPRYITLGSIAIILQGTSGGLEIYIADSNKQWNSLTTISGGISGSDFSPDISNPQDGQVLVYDGTAGKWVNGAGGGGSSLMVEAILTVEQDTPIITLDKTWQEIRDAVDDGKTVNIIMDNNEGQKQETNFLQILNISYTPGNALPYAVGISIPGGEQVFDLAADSANGYPTISPVL